MSENLSSDQIEIIGEFVQESRYMLDQLEPTIIELGQNCQNVDCWRILNCTREDCPRHGANSQIPCWLDTGFIAGGSGACGQGQSEQDCIDCDAFQQVNGDPETMNAIFRLFHSMKGSAGFLDFENIAHVAHTAENLLDLIRSGKIRMQPKHVDLLCRACDFAKEALDHVEAHCEDKSMSESGGSISEELEEAIRSAEGECRKKDEPSLKDLDLEMTISSEMVERFCQEAYELLQNVEHNLLKWIDSPGNPEIVGEIFRDIHSFKGNCGFFGYESPERLSHAMETYLEAAKEGDRKLDAASAEILLEMVDCLETTVAEISQGGVGGIENLENHLAQLGTLVDPSKPDESQAHPGEDVGGSKVASIDAKIPKNGARPETTVPAGEGKGSASGKKTKPLMRRHDIRVDLEKLDNLINLIGEMVIAENMVIHNPDLEGMELDNFQKAGQQMQKIVRELQEMAMNIRMIPVSGLFRRMIRLVHDLSVKSGKKIDLKLSGEETEVDKTIIETITDPLVHLLRNCVDHGLETPEERNSGTKPKKGTIYLSARHEEGEIWITVEDDGRGLNREKILDKAIANGLIQGDGTDLSDREVFRLIFRPGFSTADQVTDISGRGVGMDVVKQNLEKIKGKIDVQSKMGHGTRFILRIPLTLGIIEGMLVRAGDSKCIVPLLAIQTIFRPQDKSFTVTPDGTTLVRVREKFHPLVFLHEVLGGREAPPPEDGIILVLEHQDQRICLVVDEVLGQQQTVIKGLSEFIGDLRSASGCTILGNGEVCMILDIGGLIHSRDHEIAL